MVVSKEEYNFLYFRIPKTASSTIKACLKPYTIRVVPFKYKPFDYIERHPEKIGDWKSKFKFTFVRNPYDRMVSRYWHYVDRVKRRFPDRKVYSFEELITKMKVDLDNGVEDKKYKIEKPQIHYITDNDNKIIVDIIGRFENLQSDYERVCRMLKLQSIKLPHNNKGVHRPKKHYSELYTPKTYAIVTEMYKEDLERLDYKF